MRTFKSMIRDNLVKKNLINGKSVHNIRIERQRDARTLCMGMCVRGFFKIFFATYKMFWNVQGDADFLRWLKTFFLYIYSKFLRNFLEFQEIF